jgi:hypothetical protein
MPQAEFEPTIQCTSDQGRRLRPRGYWIGNFYVTLHQLIRKGREETQ